MLGVDKPGTQLKFNSSEVLVSGKTISGCLFGGLKPKSDMAILVKKYMDKVTLSCRVRVDVSCCVCVVESSLSSVFMLVQELELDKFVTHEVGFGDINKAFDLLHQGKSLRCVIWMDT